MLADALGTYAVAIFSLAAAVAIGAGALAACGFRSWSWTAPAVGLGVLLLLAWWAVRLPGEGITALLVIAAVAIGAGALAIARIDDLAEAQRRALPAVGLTLAAGSIPFLVESHFGVLGSGFNVDMSQHLFAADWLADPGGPAPGLVEQGYPLGPHAVAVAGEALTGNLATSFSGFTIAIPAIAALTALGALGRLGPIRAAAASALVALVYMSASFLAQGSFKELVEATLLLGFALHLGALSGSDRPTGAPWLRALPLALLAAGALYSYSAPGLVWLGAALLAWGAIELGRRRHRGAAALRSALPAALVALLALLALAAPELDRIVEFGGSAGALVDASADPGGAPADRFGSLAASIDPPSGDRGSPDALEFDNDLGNLFGQIDPLQVLGVWPSGDFRVEPGGGAVPAALFYLGALLGAAALALGAVRYGGEGESALLAALAGALAIWLAARLVSTPYTTAKALLMAAPLVALLATRAALAPAGAASGAAAVARVVLGAVFVAAASLSSALALANAPVGPSTYEPGVAELRDRLSGEPVLLLTSQTELDEQHGREFYGWELRGADPGCVAPTPPSATPPPRGIRFVITIGASRAPPFEGLRAATARGNTTLWKVLGDVSAANPVLSDPDDPTVCALDPRSAP